MITAEICKKNSVESSPAEECPSVNQVRKLLRVSSALERCRAKPSIFTIIKKINIRAIYEREKESVLAGFNTEKL